MSEDLDSILETKSQRSAVDSVSIHPATADVNTFIGATKQAFALMSRYRDAYLVARAVNGYGDLVKTIGIIAAIIFSIVGLLLLVNWRTGEAVFAMGVVTIAVGLVVGTLFYLIGVLISAQGQILKASLDSAVNGSPFLTNEHRAQIMSLPKA